MAIFVNFGRKLECLFDLFCNIEMQTGNTVLKYKQTPANQKQPKGKKKCWKFFQKISRNTSLYIKNIVLTTPDGLNLRYSISKATLWEQVKNESKTFWFTGKICKIKCLSKIRTAKILWFWLFKSYFIMFSSKRNR